MAASATGRLVLAARRLIAFRWLAMLLCMATLALRLVVPTGFMIGSVDGQPVIEWCPGMIEHAAGVASDPMPGMAAAMPGHGSGDHSEGGHGPAGHATEQCPFAGLAAPALAGADPLLLVGLLVHIVAAVRRRAVPPPPLGHPNLRPPLRGPPATT